MSTITDDTGKKFDELYSIYNKYTKNQETSVFRSKKKTGYVENFLLYMFDWKIVFTVLFIILVGCLVLFNELIKKLNKDNILDDTGISMVSFFLYGVSFNMFIVIFIITLFFYKKKIAGSKGRKGDIGERGLDGKNNMCDICNRKPQKISRKKPLEETVRVDTHPDIDISSKKEGLIKTTIDIKFGDKNNCDGCITKEYVYSPDIKYLTGVIAGYNSKEQAIDGLQFLYKNTDNETVLNGGDDVWGKKSASRKEILCPDQSAIYKIESMFRPSSIKKNAFISGLKIYCKNTEDYTENNPVDNEIGIGYSETSSTFKNALAQCENISRNRKTYTGFLADVSGTYKNNINEINFTKCRYNII